MAQQVVVLAGLPRDTLKTAVDLLSLDTSLKNVVFTGAPSTQRDQRPLYPVETTRQLIRNLESACDKIDPNRIFALYVPSSDARELVPALRFVCYLIPVYPINPSSASDTGHLAWRHDWPIVRAALLRTLRKAKSETDALKAEITDRRISPFSLPARNFFHPDRRTPIEHTYNELAMRSFIPKDLSSKLQPQRFTRDQLSGHSFKSRQYSAEFFEDARERVFPPDRSGHGRAHPANAKEFVNEISLRLQQHYRFGVRVRDGNVHYDVQFGSGRRLSRERMHCAQEGEVAVSGTHANVGVNDVVWVPNGAKVLLTQH